MQTTFSKANVCTGTHKMMKKRFENAPLYKCVRGCQLLDFCCSTTKTFFLCFDYISNRIICMNFKCANTRRANTLGSIHQGPHCQLYEWCRHFHSFKKSQKTHVAWCQCEAEKHFSFKKTEESLQVKLWSYWRFLTKTDKAIKPCGLNFHSIGDLSYQCRVTVSAFPPLWLPAPP